MMQNKKDRKKISPFIVTIMSLILLLGGSFWMSQADEKKCVSTEQTEPPTGELLLTSPFKMKKPPMKFDHGKHVADKIACTECHHVYEDGKNVWHQGDVVQPCCACHMEKTENNVPSLERAFHTNCRDCHRDLQKEGKVSGPYKKCTECHKQD